MPKKKQNPFTAAKQSAQKCLAKPSCNRKQPRKKRVRAAQKSRLTRQSRTPLTTPTITSFYQSLATR